MSAAGKNFAYPIALLIAFGSPYHSDRTAASRKLDRRRDDLWRGLRQLLFNLSHFFSAWEVSGQAEPCPPPILRMFVPGLGHAKIAMCSRGAASVLNVIGE